ncbi:hypothetical protein [Haloferula sp. BvORR071]|uniref:hypothetical protein n=1 Tax=Haloferula sp. BvORR071 TaxID=1396141 RepID=UPI002240F023|nr:hypothetical protein [Haloferula sp. BvORR071]
MRALPLAILCCGLFPAAYALEGVGVHLAAGSGVPKGLSADEWKEHEFNAILYTGKSEGDKLSIVPTLECPVAGDKKGNYLKLLADGGPIAPVGYSCEYDITFPALDLKVVNNSKKALQISEVRMMVEESRPDLTPLPQIFSDYDQVQHIELYNEGWGRIEKADFDFNLLPGKPKGKPSAELPFHQTLYRVEKPTKLQLNAELEKAGLPAELTKLGGEYQNLRNKITDLYDKAGENISEDLEKQNEALDEQCSEIAAKMHKIGDGLKTGPFKVKPDQFGDSTIECWMHGWLNYTWKEGETEKSNRVALRVPVLILPPDGLGATGPVEGKYEAMLRESDKDYALKVPVTQTVKPGATTRFTVTLGVPKSSFHRFKVALVSTDGAEIDAGLVELQALLPRSAVGQLEMSAKAPKEEGE